MRKVLFVGDGVTRTGFSTVTHNIIKRIPKDKFEVHHLAINYYGDPHPYDWLIYPASLGGDIYGVNRLGQLNLEQFSGIFLLNDIAVIQAYLKAIKNLNLKKIPPIIVYTPIDGYGVPARFYKEFDIVSQYCVYTKFAYDEIKKSVPNIEPKIITHGIDTSIFFKLFEKREQAKLLVFQDVKTDFLVFNGNRNQPRKKIDLTIEGFKLFGEKSAKLYLHCGMKDAGWYIPDLVKYYGLEEKIIMTEAGNKSLPQIQESALNLLYNAADVGINTAVGEGFGLVNVEHAVTGVPQIVPNHTACKELFQDVGLLIDVAVWEHGTDMSVIHGVVSPESLAKHLTTLYTNHELYNKLANASIEKFSQKEYNWDYIVAEQWMPLFERLWT